MCFERTKGQIGVTLNLQRLLGHIGAARSGPGAPPRAIWWPAVAALGLGLVLLAGCSVPYLPQNSLEPETEYGWKIQHLFELILWLAAFVFVVVEGALLYTIWRYRARPGQGRPRQIHGNTRLEIAWTIAPAVVLAVIAVPTIQTIFAIGGPPPTDSLQVEVIGHQWWWEFRYPQLNVVTANEVHMPAGKNVSFDLKSADVIHSFWFPRLGGKRDVVPTHTYHLWLDAPQQPAEYFGQCAEFCGASHANMRMRAFVDSQANFDAWVKNQLAPATPPAPQVANGSEIFQRSACIGCHTISGTNARGEVGPNLTHVGSRKSIAAGVLENTPQEMTRWIEDPEAIKPGAKMPAFKGAMSDDDIAAVVAYLQSLK